MVTIIGTVNTDSTTIFRETVSVYSWWPFERTMRGIVYADLIPWRAAKQPGVVTWISFQMECTLA